MIQCQQSKPRWNAAVNFCVRTLNAPRPVNNHYAIIFGLADPNTLLPESSRAFLRHVYGSFYHDFSNMDVKGTQFHWPITLRNAAHAFLDAVLHREAFFVFRKSNRRRVMGERRPNGGDTGEETSHIIPNTEGPWRIHRMGLPH